MTPVYHLDRPHEKQALQADLDAMEAKRRLRKAVRLPSRQARSDYLAEVRREHGELAAQALIEGLHQVAKERNK